MTFARTQMGAMPLVLRLAGVGAAAALLLGGLAGLVLGLRAYPATAWFAVLEVGIPASILGAVFGALTGVVTRTIQKVNRR